MPPMRTRSIAEKLCFSISLIGFGLALSGTKACQEDYNFAAQSNITPSATESPTATEDNGITTLTPTPTTTGSQPSVTPTSVTTPTVTPTISTQAGLLDALRAVGTNTALDHTSDTNKTTNPYAEALRNKPENWLGTAFAHNPPAAIIDSDRDGYTDWLEDIMGSNPGDLISVPPYPVTHLKERIGLTSQEAEDRLHIFEQTMPAESRNLDTDGDGLRDNLEIAIGSGPNKQDSDGDGILDGKEFDLGSDPVKPEAQQR